jgi:hypothetical protein
VKKRGKKPKKKVVKKSKPDIKAFFPLDCPKCSGKHMKWLGFAQCTGQFTLDDIARFLGEKRNE